MYFPGISLGLRGERHSTFYVLWKHGNISFTFYEFKRVLLSYCDPIKLYFLKEMLELYLLQYFVMVFSSILFPLIRLWAPWRQGNILYLHLCFQYFIGQLVTVFCQNSQFSSCEMKENNSYQCTWRYTMSILIQNWQNFSNWINQFEQIDEK